MMDGEGGGTVPYIRERVGRTEMIARAETFLQVALQRRSVRHFSSDPVPDEVLELAVRAAVSAPSGANMQPWKFVIVKDPKLKHSIRIAAEKEERESYEHRMTEQWLRALEPLGTDWHKDFLEIAPALIVVFKEDYHFDEEGQRVLHYYVAESVGIACGMLLAALNAAGLSTLTHTPSPMRFLGEILQRPAHEKPYLLVPVGYPAEGCRVPDIRKKDLGEVLLWS